MGTNSSITEACDASIPARENWLLARCQQGDSEAWDEFFDRYYTSIARFLFKLSYDFERYEVEDISRNVFLRAIRDIGNFEGHYTLESWLLGMALEEGRTHHLHLCPIGHSPSSKRTKNGETDDLAWLGKQLDKLDSFHRGIIELYYIGALSHEEIAAVLNLDLADITLGLKNALDQLQHSHKTRPANPVRREPALTQPPDPLGIHPG